MPSLCEQEIEGEGFGRRGRRGWRRCRHGRARAFAGRGRHRTIIFLAQRRARCIGGRRSNPGARRRVERALAPTACEPKRCGHGGHQGQPAPSVDRLFHLHPTLSPRLRDRLPNSRNKIVPTIPDRRAGASVACGSPQVILFPPFFSFRRAWTTISLPEFGHFSARCHRSWCGSRPSARQTIPGTPPW